MFIYLVKGENPNQTCPQNTTDPYLLSLQLPKPCRVGTAFLMPIVLHKLDIFGGHDKAVPTLHWFQFLIQMTIVLEQLDVNNKDGRSILSGRSSYLAKDENPNQARPQNTNDPYLLSSQPPKWYPENTSKVFKRFLST
jgi:hypothetical protein